LNCDILIVGAGVAGLGAAIASARQKLSTILIEKESELGGLLRNLDTIWPTGVNSDELLKSFKETIEKDERIEVMTNTTLLAVEGTVGRFKIKLKRLNSSSEKQPDTEIGPNTSETEQLQKNLLHSLVSQALHILFYLNSEKLFV